MENSKDGLRAEELVKVFKERKVVSGVSVAIHPGEVVGLLGPNGAGKTTTFYMILGLVRPDGGRVFLNGEEITTLPVYQRARRGIGFLPQEVSVFRRLTVRENLMAVLETLPLSEAEQMKRVDDLLHELNIAYLAGTPAYSLSGGERRRTEIARSLAMSPAFILLDEPFSGIDPVIPVLTFSGLTLAGLLNGSVAIEVVFAWPGIGRLMLEGIKTRDFPIVQATVLAAGFFYIFTALVVDILYAYVNPRIRFE